MTTYDDDKLTSEVFVYRTNSDFHVERGRTQMMQEILRWLVKQDSPESLIISKELRKDLKDINVTPIADSLDYFIDINCAYDPNSSQSDHVGDTVGSA